MSSKNIAIIGAGKMAGILSNYFATAGHKVHIGAREKNKARQLANEIGQGVLGGSIDDAIQHGDIVLFAIPYLEIQNTVNLTGPLNGKIVVDMSNPLKPDFSGLLIGGDTSAGEELARALPKAKVVKAFNCVFATTLERGAEFGEMRAQIFYAGDDKDAKQAVAELIETTGFEPIDTGDLISARFMEQLTMLVLQIDNNLKAPVQITPAMLARPSIPQ